MKTKRAWEWRIKELGGPNYLAHLKTYDDDGNEIPQRKGYQYFGAARDLPGVKELFEKEKPAPPKRTRAELYRAVDMDYYGLGADADGALERAEQEVEQERVAEKVLEWHENDAQKRSGGGNSAYAGEVDEGDAGTGAALPTAEEVERAVVARRKAELMRKYVSDELMMETEEAQDMSNAQRRV